MSDKDGRVGDNPPMRYELAFVGAGNMAEAIARGVLRAGVFEAVQLVAADVSAPRRELFERELMIRAVGGVAQAADAGTIVLCVKPQQMSAVLGELASVIDRRSLVISIAAGISTRFIEQALAGRGQIRVIRTMPNTPMLLGCGMVAAARGKFAADADMALARRVFESGAKFIEIGEEKLDAVTAVSGSGPAYFFYMVEKMIEAGVALGLTPQEAHALATTTCLGAGRMLSESADAPQELRRKVTSPGGTTQAAIEVMESRGVGDAIVAAVQRAAQRSRELGK